MNATDRKTVAEALAGLAVMIDTLDNIGAALRDLADAEREKFDNLSEGLQGAQSGQDIEAAAEALEAAADACDNTDVGEAVTHLESIS